jgi:hypothetical protein
VGFPVQEFNSNLEASAFGEALHTYALTMDKLQHDRRSFLKHICPVDPVALDIQVRGPELTPYWGSATGITAKFAQLWMERTWEVSMWDALEQSKVQTVIDSVIAFDEMWLFMDSKLWRIAHSLEKVNEPGRLTREFGLFDPNAKDRPFASEVVLRQILAEEESSRKAKTTPAPAPSPYVDNIPIAAPTDKATISGHAYLQELNAEAKSKAGAKAQDSAVPKATATTADGPDGVKAAGKKRKKKSKAAGAQDGPQEDEEEPAAENEMQEDDIRE